MPVYVYNSMIKIEYLISSRKNRLKWMFYVLRRNLEGGVRVYIDRWSKHLTVYRRGLQIGESFSLRSCILPLKPKISGLVLECFVKNRISFIVNLFLFELFRWSNKYKTYLNFTLIRLRRSLIEICQ